MAILGTFPKQPLERLDYDLDFQEWLPSGDLIVSATAVASTGITVETPLIDATQKVVKVWVTGGTTGVTYKIQVTATTAEGRVKEGEIRIKVRDY